MRFALNYCTIKDVELTEPKPDDKQKKSRKVYIDCDEEDFFEMLDSVNPKNIVKYLDMRKIDHREALQVNVTNTKVVLLNDDAKRGLYRMNQRNKKKLDRVLDMLNKKDNGKRK